MQADGTHYRLIEPASVAAAQAIEKGVLLHLTDGSQLFDYITLKELLRAYPAFFLRVHHSWIVRMDLVDGTQRAGAEMHLVLRGVAVRPRVSRRGWSAVQRHFFPAGVVWPR